MPISLATGARNAMADALDTVINTGAGTAKIRIYSGSQPADANAAVTGTLLAEFNLANPAFGAASAGVITLSGTPLNTTGLASGTAGYFRILDRGGNSVLDGSVGTSGAQLNLNTTTISVGVSVTISSGTFTQPAA